MTWIGLCILDFGISSVKMIVLVESVIMISVFQYLLIACLRTDVWYVVFCDLFFILRCRFITTQVTPFTHFISSLIPLVTSALFSVSVCLFLFSLACSFILFVIFHIWVKSYGLCFSIWRYHMPWSLKLHLYCKKWQDFIFYGWIVFLCVCVSHLYLFTLSSLLSQPSQRCGALLANCFFLWPLCTLLASCPAGFKWQCQDCSDPKGKPLLHFCLTLTNTAHQSSCKWAQRSKGNSKGTTVHDNMS